MESQTRASKRALRDLKGMRVRDNRKGGYRKLTFAHVRQAKRWVRCTFQGSFSGFSISNGKLIRIKTGLDTDLIRIQTRTPL